jgi:hypothetical protein
MRGDTVGPPVKDMGRGDSESDGVARCSAGDARARGGSGGPRELPGRAGFDGAAIGESSGRGTPPSPPIPVAGRIECRASRLVAVLSSSLSCSIDALEGLDTEAAAASCRTNSEGGDCGLRPVAILRASSSAATMSASVAELSSADTTASAARDCMRCKCLTSADVGLPLDATLDRDCWLSERTMA